MRKVCPHLFFPLGLVPARGNVCSMPFSSFTRVSGEAPATSTSVPEKVCELRKFRDRLSVSDFGILKQHGYSSGRQTNHFGREDRCRQRHLKAYSMFSFLLQIIYTVDQISVDRDDPVLFQNPVHVSQSSAPVLFRITFPAIESFFHGTDDGFVPAACKVNRSNAMKDPEKW